MSITHQCVNFFKHSKYDWYRFSKVTGRSGGYKRRITMSVRNIFKVNETHAYHAWLRSVYTLYIKYLLSSYYVYTHVLVSVFCYFGVT